MPNAHLGRGHSEIACWVGSGPSDPRRHGKPIGNASTGRLVKVVKLETVGTSRSTHYFRILLRPYYQWVLQHNRLRRESVLKAQRTLR